MSMMLWKTLVLGGVIGVGSVVVVQAKRSLDQSPTTASDLKPDEEFPLLDGDTGLETSFKGSTGALEPKKLPEPEAAQALAALNPTAPDENPFGGEPASSEISRASAEVDGNDDPFSAAPRDQTGGQSEPASTVTLDEPSKDQFALLDSTDTAPTGEQAELNPFEVTQAGASAGEPAQPLKKLSSGNDGPVLRRTPSEEPTAGEADNPFARYASPPASPAAEPQAVPESGPLQFDASPALSAPPPLRTREPAASTAIELPPATLNPEPSQSQLRRRDVAPEQSEPDVASQQDAGLAAPQAPRLPVVAPEDAPGRVRVAEADVSTSQVIEQGTALPDFPPLNLTGGQSNGNGSRAIPADISSIPGIPSESAAPKSLDRTIPNEASSIPGDVGTVRGNETTPQGNSRPTPGLFIPDETPSTRTPAAIPGSSIPNSPPAIEASPFDNSRPAASPVSSAATSPTTQPDLNGFGVIDRNVATGPAQPQLTILKHAPSEAVIGQDLEYSILVRNIGRSAAHHVVVEDLIPRGSKCTGTIPKAESQVEKKNLIWKFGTLAAGAEQLIRVRITPTEAGEIGSVATVSFSAEVTAMTVIVEPKAVLTVAGPPEAVVGEASQFKFTVTNNGPVDLKGVIVRTLLPPQGLTHPGGNDLEYELGDLPRGKSREVALAMTPSQPGDWKFDTMVNLGGRELAKAQAGLHVVGARLTVVRSGPTKRFVGRPATYSNTVTNNSLKLLTNVTIVETLPNGLDPSGQMSKDVRWDPARRTLTWVIPQLVPGQAIDLPCTVMPKIAGALQGNIVARDPSGNHVEIATALEVAGFSSLVVDGGHDGRPVAVGDQVSFRFSVKNRGTAPAEQVVAMFDLPDEVELINAQGPGNLKYQRDGRVVLFEPMPVVPVNGELTYDVVVQAKAATPTNSVQRVLVKLYSTQLPADRPLEQEQQLVIYGDDDDAQPVQRASGVR